MGAHKRVHIQRITELDSVRQRWQDAHGRLPTDDDVESMFKEFVPLQLECLSEYSELIPGTLEVVGELRRRGIKIGSTTGYTTPMMEINLRDAERQGYQPDSTVCASDVPAGRPYPFMCLQNAINLGVTTVRACVKVDDTVPGVEEGLNAGMWTIGLADQRQRGRSPAARVGGAAAAGAAGEARARLPPAPPVRRALRRRHHRGRHAVPRRHPDAHPPRRAGVTRSLRRGSQPSPRVPPAAVRDPRAVR